MTLRYFISLIADKTASSIVGQVLAIRKILNSQQSIFFLLANQMNERGSEACVAFLRRVGVFAIILWYAFIQGLVSLSEGIFAWRFEFEVYCGLKEVVAWKELACRDRHSAGADFGGKRTICIAKAQHQPRIIIIHQLRGVNVQIVSQLRKVQYLPCLHDVR